MSLNFFITFFFFQFQYKEAEGSSYREGSYPETPGTPKVSDRLILYINYNSSYCRVEYGLECST